MEVIVLKTYQKVLFPILLFLSFVFTTVLAQILNFKPNWGYGLFYCSFATLTVYYLYMTFYYNKSFQ